MTEAESTSFETVLDKFDHYFKPHTSVIYERARLNQRTQQQGETVEQFLSSIHELAENCGYTGTHKAEQIRDKIVAGILNYR